MNIEFKDYADFYSRVLGLLQAHLLANSQTVNWEVSLKEKISKRNLDQNALSHHWYKELQAQGDMTIDEYRNFCKYRFGLPVLFRDGGYTADVVRKALESLEYEERLEFVSTMAVTSTFNKSEMSEYLDEVFKYFTTKGKRLTTREDYARSHL